MTSLLAFTAVKGLPRALHRAERDAASIHDAAKAARRATLLQSAGAEALAKPFAARAETLLRQETS